MGEIRNSKPAFLTCQVIRVTPYGQDGYPNHAQGFTYWFDKPVTLAYVQRERVPEIGSEPILRASRAVPSLASFLAPGDHPQRTDLAYVARYIRLRVGVHVAVEVWSPHADGYAYTLFPYWRHASPDDWPREPFPAAPVHCVGAIVPAPSASTWSAPGLPGYEVHAGTSALIAVTAVPPPPAAGLPALSADSARMSGAVRRTPVRTGAGTGGRPHPTSAGTARTPPDTPAADTPRTPGRRDTPDTRRTPPDTDSGQGVRVEYRARVPRRQISAALAEAAAHIARETRADTPRTPPDTVRPLPANRRERTAAAIAAAFDIPEHLLRRDTP